MNTTPNRVSAASAVLLILLAALPACVPNDPSAPQAQPKAVTGGQTFDLVVPVTPNPGKTVTIMVSSPDVGVVPIGPMYVQVPVGESQAIIQGLPTEPVAQNTKILLTVQEPGQPDRTAAIEVRAPTIAALSVPASLPSGGSGQGAVQLTGPTSFSGMAVVLSSSDPAARVPSKLLIAPGQTSAIFPIGASGVASDQEVTITAANTESFAQADMQIVPPTLMELLPAQSSAAAGAQVSAVVNLSGPAPPGGMTVVLASDDPAATVPVDVVIAEGHPTASFRITTHGVDDDTTANLSASLGGHTLGVRFQVQSAVLGAVSIEPGTVRGGKSTEGFVELSGPAGPSGVTLALVTDQPAATSMPSSIHVAAGETTASFDLVTSAVTAQTIAKIEAHQGPEGVSDSLVVLPPAPGRFFVDQEFQPEIFEMPPLEHGGAARVVSAVTDASGIPAYFVQDELILSTDELDVLSEFVSRWGGQILSELHPSEMGIALPPVYVVQIQTALVDTNTFEQDMEAMLPGSNTEGRFASQSDLALVAAAARAWSEGLSVGLNWVKESDAIADGFTSEAMNGPDLDGPSGPDVYTPDAFQWRYLETEYSDQNTADHAVTKAWGYLQRSGFDAARVPLAILDGGFMANDPDMPADQIALSNISGAAALGSMSPTQCTGNQPCPWHGTGVVQTAAGLIDNGVGTAGTGGQVVRPITVHTALDDFALMTAFTLAASQGATMLNMSFGQRIPACYAELGSLLQGFTLSMSQAGIALFASAGNIGENVDETEDGDEVAWWVPCEHLGVTCVGGSSHASHSHDPGSNYGRSFSSPTSVDIWAPYTVQAGASPSGDPTGNNVGSISGTSFSSPYTAGVAAMMQATDPSLVGSALTQLLVNASWKDNYPVRVHQWVNAAEGLRQSMGDVPPEVKITLPPDGASVGFLMDEFRAEASDEEDANLVVHWSSDQDGSLGTGLINFFSNLSPGGHIITATVTDSNGWTVSDQINVSKFNNSPWMEIIEPLPAWTFWEGQIINFRGNSFDLDSFAKLSDGDVQWWSSIDGPLLVGHEINVSLSVGSHTISFIGYDDNGAGGAAYQTVVVYGSSGDDPPDATILSPSQSVVLPKGTPITLLGSGKDDEDGTLTGASLVWTSNLDGVVGTGSPTVTLSYNQCGLREHQVTLTVTDSASQSGYDVVQIVMDDAGGGGC